MLNENIKNLRKAKGLSQEELAVRLNVVRQTVSKWEQGLSVPDADMLIAVSEALETPVSVLLEETAAPAPADDRSALAERLDAIDRQLTQRRVLRWKLLYYALISLAAVILVLFAFFLAFQSQYLNWNYRDPETAIAGTFLHAAEYLFVRIAPFAWIGAVAGSILVWRKIASFHA